MNILERYQLALSYKEKSKQDQCEWLELVKKKTFDQTHYDLVKATYDRHIKQATELCNTIRNAQKNSIDDLEEDILSLTRQQQKLIRYTAEGKLKPQKANKQGRLLANEKNRFQTILDTAHAIINAESSESIGGFIDFPFDEYEAKLELDNTTTPPPESEDPEAKKELNLKNVALLVLAGLLVWWGVDYYRTMGKTTWSTEITNHKQFLKVQCLNTGNSTIRVYVPWPDGNVNAETAPKLKRVSFGVLLYVREKGKTQFQLLPETPDIWSVGGNPHTTRSPIAVRSGKNLNITLDTLTLRKSGLKVDAVKLEFTRYGGRKVGGTQEIILP